ncbi:hypothetical protein D9M71_772120 [compost metagenome]
MALEGGIAIDLQRLGRFGHAGHGPGLTHPSGGDGQGRTALQGEVDPAIQLRVAIDLPPLRGGPIRILRGALDCFVGGQRIGLQRLALRGNTSGSDAAADCQG